MNRPHFGNLITKKLSNGKHSYDWSWLPVAFVAQKAFQNRFCLEMGRRAEDSCLISSTSLNSSRIKTSLIVRTFARIVSYMLFYSMQCYLVRSKLTQ